jgi:hypothetical protein
MSPDGMVLGYIRNRRTRGNTLFLNKMFLMFPLHSAGHPGN